MEIINFIQRDYKGITKKSHNNFYSRLNFVNEKNELKDYAIQSVFSVENEFFLVGTLFCRFKIDDINVFMTDQKFNLIFTI